MMTAIERMGIRFDGQLDTGVKRLVDSLVDGETVTRAAVAPRAPRRAGAGRSGTQGGGVAAINSAFDEAVGQLEQATQEPEQLAESLANTTRQIAAADPDVAAQLSASVTRAIALLAERLPPTATVVEPYLGAPPTDPHDRVLLDEQRDWLALVDTIADPLSVLDHAQAGTLVREHVEALQAAYPEMHSTMVQRVVEEVADRGADLPYTSRVRLSLLVDVPTDASLAPGYVLRSQSVFTAEDEQPADGPMVTPGNASAPALAGMEQTQVQGLAERVS